MHIIRRKSLLALFLTGMVSIIILLSVLHFVELYYFRTSKFEQEIALLEEIQLTKQKELIQREVDSAIDYIRFQDLQMTMQAKARLQNRAEEAYQVAISLYEKYHNQLTQSELSELIAEALRGIRFNDGRGYFFAFRIDGTAVLLPFQPEREGSNLLESDLLESRFVGGFITLAERQGEGFYQYQWYKPGQGDGLRPKLSYIKYFAPADMLLGTGDYLEDIRAENKSAAIAWLGSIRFGSDGFLFALDFDSKMIAHAEPSLIGNRMLDSVLPQIRSAFPEMLSGTTEHGTFVEYQFRRPQLESMSRKVSYVARIPDWEWIVGAGFFVDSLMSAIDEQRKQLKDALMMDFMKMGVMSLLAILLVALIVRFGSRKLQQNIDLFNDFFFRAASQSTPLEKSDIIFKEFAPMAEAINGMVKERRSIEKDRKHLEAMLLQRQKLEAIGTLAGGIAHDFNNLLAAMFGNLSLLSLKYDHDAKQRKYLDRIQDSANKARDLVAQILCFSRYSEGNRRLLDFRLVVSESIELLRSTIPSSVSLEVQMQEDTMPLMADKTQLHQVLMNLCGNASHALPAQTGIIQISLFTLARAQHELLTTHAGFPGDRVAHLTVRDNGVGIAKEIITKIFDPFFSTRATGKGTGLGLSIVHRIVRQHGGVLDVESQLGQGSAFHVFLPLSSSQPETSSIPEEATVSGKGLVLLVDDDKSILESTSELLEHLGYKVVAMSSSQEACRFLIERRESVSVLITDQTMPGMSGLELISKTREYLPDLPIILCTGFSEQVNQSTLKDLNLAGFLMKPVSLSKISQILKKCL